MKSSSRFILLNFHSPTYKPPKEIIEERSFMSFVCKVREIIKKLEHGFKQLSKDIKSKNHYLKLVIFQTVSLHHHEQKIDLSKK